MPGLILLHFPGPKHLSPRPRSPGPPPSDLGVLASSTPDRGPGCLSPRPFLPRTWPPASSAGPDVISHPLEHALGMWGSLGGWGGKSEASHSPLGVSGLLKGLLLGAHVSSLGP